MIAKATALWCVALMLALAGCASTQAEEYRDAADDLAEDLIDQLEQRTDTRQVRLLVTEFQSDNPMGGRPATHRHANLSKHIKHQLMKVRGGVFHRDYHGVGARINRAVVDY